MKSLLFFFAFIFAVSARGQEFTGLRTEAEATFANTSPARRVTSSFQLYTWEDFRISKQQCFLMQRQFYVEGGSKLLETGAGCKDLLPLLKAATVAWSTDGQLVTAFTFGGKILGHQIVAIGDHKWAITSPKSGFLFAKGYFFFNSRLVGRWEGVYRDDGVWTAVQPGIEWRQPFKNHANQHIAFVLEYDTKNRGLVGRIDWRKTK